MNRIFFVPVALLFALQQTYFVCASEQRSEAQSDQLMLIVGRVTENPFHHRSGQLSSCSVVPSLSRGPDGQSYMLEEVELGRAAYAILAQQGPHTRYFSIEPGGSFSTMCIKEKTQEIRALRQSDRANITKLGQVTKECKATKETLRNLQEKDHAHRLFIKQMLTGAGIGASVVLLYLLSKPVS